MRHFINQKCQHKRSNSLQRNNNDHKLYEIKKMLKIGKKAEQQSFSKYGLEYVVDTYFPEKLEAME